MAISEELIVKISADTSEARVAVNSIDKQVKALAGSVEGSARNVSAFKAAWLNVSAGLSIAQTAFSAVSGVIGKIGKETQGGEKELKRLSFALASNGEFSSQAVNGFIEYSKSLREATTVDDGFINTLIAQAKTMRLSDEMTKKLIETSIALSNVTGDAVEDSFNKLKMTLLGNGKVLKEFKNDIGSLTEDELRNGKAVELLNQKYGAFRDAAKGSVSGDLADLSNSFNDLAEAIGAIAVNSGFLVFVKDLTKGLNELIPVISTLTQGFFSFLNILGDVGAAIGGVVATTSRIFSKGDFKESMALTANAVADIGKELNKTANASKAATASISKYESKLKSISETNKGIKPPKFISDEQKKLAEEMAKNLSDLTSENTKLRLEIDTANMGARDALDARLSAELQILATKASQLKLDESGKQAIAEQADLLVRRIEMQKKLAASPEFEGQAKPLMDIAKAIPSATNEAASGVVGAISGVMAGAGSLMSAISGALDFAQQLIDFIPGLLEKVANIFNSLTDLP